MYVCVCVCVPERIKKKAWLKQSVLIAVVKPLETAMMTVCFSKLLVGGRVVHEKGQAAHRLCHLLQNVR